MANQLSDKDVRDSIKKQEAKDANRDPITGAPGSHPVGTGVGAAVAGTAGAALGAMAGPAGALAGAAIGSAIGGAIGHSAGEAIDPTVETEYWRANYSGRPYIVAGSSYADYEPAYRTGWEARARNDGRTFEEVEGDLGSDWDRNRGESSLDWERAREASRDAWDRVDQANRR